MFSSIEPMRFILGWVLLYLIYIIFDSRLSFLIKYDSVQDYHIVNKSFPDFTGFFKVYHYTKLVLYNRLTTSVSISK